MTELIGFPLLAGSPDPYCVTGLSYPRTFSFRDGSRAPLFVSGVVEVAELDLIARTTAARIARHYGNRRLLVIQVLEGARTFAAMVVGHLGRLARGERPEFELASIRVRSYGQGTRASAHQVLQPLRDSAHREITEVAGFGGVVVVDDLIDGGDTVAWLVGDYLPRLAARGVGVCTMLTKERPRSREVEGILAEHLLSGGRRVADEWLVGYGLDMALPGGEGRPSLHLFRQALPGGIYAFNQAIEQRLLADHLAAPEATGRQLGIYLSPA